MELRLMEAKHEANRTKEETERQAELEREVNNYYWIVVVPSYYYYPLRIWNFINYFSVLSD